MHRRAPTPKTTVSGTMQMVSQSTVDSIRRLEAEDAAQRLAAHNGEALRPGMNLYYVVTPENTFAVVAAPDLETAYGVPPYSNWRDLLAFNGWDEECGKRCQFVCIASPSTLDPGSTPGVLIAGGMGFYSSTKNAVQFV